MEELNKKIAEWVFPNADKIKVEQGTDGIIIIVIRDMEAEFIDAFTSSLDTLFQFAVPKLTEVLHYRDFYKFLIAWVAEVADGKKAALMFCRAVEELIDNS